MPSSNLPLWWQPFENPTRRLRPRIRPGAFGDGFIQIRTEGSHRRFRHPDGRYVSVSSHKDSDTFPIGTLRKMIVHQARRTEGDLRRLRLIE